MKKEVKNLLEELKSSDEEKRYAAAISLGDLGDKSAEVIAALCEALNDESNYVRSEAGEALAKLGYKKD